MEKWYHIFTNVYAWVPLPQERHQSYSDIPLEHFVNIMLQRVDVGSDNVRLQIWDLGGQDFLGNVRAKFYSGARGVVFMYDVTRSDTLEEIEGWRNEVSSHVKDYTSLIVANKTDLEGERVISEDEGRKFAKSMGAEYIETSVKLNEGVADTFTAIAQQIVEKYRG